MLAAALILLAGIAAVPAVQLTPGQLEAHAREAQAAERKGDFSTAVREYRELADALPGNAEAQSNLGVALYFNTQLPQAIAAFRKAISLKPELLAPHLFSGIAWYRLSKPNLAAPELEEAVRLSPSNVMARIWLGYTYTAQSQNRLALSQFEAATKLDPGNVNAWYQVGEAWLQAGKDATAKLFSTDPNGGRAWELAGEQAEMMGNRQKALSEFEKAEALRPDIPELRSLIARLGGTVTRVPAQPQPHPKQAEADNLYHQAHHAEKESRVAFEKVFELAPDSYRSHQIMANAYFMEGNDGKAIAEYRAVIRLKPDLVGIHEALGEALVRNGQLPAALKEFDTEIEMQPYSAEVRVSAGRTLLLMGKDAAAEKLLNQALGMDRPPVETYLLLGRIEVTRRDYRQAIPMLEKYVSTVKSNSTAYYLLAMSYRDLGDRSAMNKYLALYKATSRDAKERR